MFLRLASFCSTMFLRLASFCSSLLDDALGHAVVGIDDLLRLPEVLAQRSKAISMVRHLLLPGLVAGPDLVEAVGVVHEVLGQVVEVAEHFLHLIAKRMEFDDMLCLLTLLRPALGSPRHSAWALCWALSAGLRTAWRARSRPRLVRWWFARPTSPSSSVSSWATFSRSTSPSFILALVLSALTILCKVLHRTTLRYHDQTTYQGG